jgi:hypothetical protein
MKMGQLQKQKKKLNLPFTIAETVFNSHCTLLSNLSNGTPGVKRPKREAHHSPPTTTEVKNKSAYSSTWQFVCMAGSKLRNNLTFHIHYLC